MPYTRRDIMRDAAFLAVGGAVGYSLSQLQGCQQPSTPAEFVSGIRIFFEGSWLFCAENSDPSKPRTMRAVTVDMAGESHCYPYGVWHDGWNDPQEKNQLLASNPGKPPYIAFGSNPYPACSVDMLFSSAQGDSPFTYIPNRDESNKFDIDWTVSGLRIVSLPLPTRIIPAAFRTDGQLSDSYGHCRKAPDSCKNIGVATSHIFEYQGADNMTFSPDTGMTLQQATGPAAHYHFHTAPTKNYGPNHAVCMFQALLQLISNFPHKDLTLITANDDPPITIGPNVPNCVKPEEFEIKTKKQRDGTYAPRYFDSKDTHNATFPTCGGGGGGLGECC